MSAEGGTTRARRWDGDERGRGVASGEAFASNLEQLRRDAAGATWVAEDADAHLMPHVRAACDAPASMVRVVGSEVRDDVLGVELAWTGERADHDEIRAEAFRVAGSFAEHATQVRQRSTTGATEFEIVTGTVADETPFRPHGHLVLLRVRHP